jgi:hypothetical protein
MYYFDFSNIDFSNFSFRPYSLYNEGHSDIVGSATVVANAKTIMYCSSDIAGNASIVVTGSHIYFRIYGDSDIATGGTITSDSLLKHYGRLNTLQGTGGVTANAKRTAFVYCDIDIAGNGSLLVIGSSLSSILRGVSDIASTGELNSYSLLKHYGKISPLQGTGVLVSDGMVKVYAIVGISGHADMNLDSIEKMFEEARIVGTGNVQSNSVLRWMGNSDITATASVGGDSKLTITGNVAIIATANLQANNIMYLRADLTDADTYSFPFDDKTFIYNGTDFLYYDGTKIGKVIDIAYVPTVSNKRTPAGVGVIGEQLNFLSPSWKDSFNGTASDTAYKLSYVADSVAVYTNGVLVAPADYTFPTGGTDYTVVTFGVAQGEGVDNVVITGTKAELTDPTVITRCTQFIVYGGKNDNRVFACRLNVRYHSGLEDATYWPIDAFEIITSDAEDITGFGKMIDYLINLKKRSLTYTDIEQDSGLFNGTTIWPVYPLNDEFGCIAKDTIKSVNNGLIFLAGTNEGSPAGVAFLSTSAVRDQLNVQIISRDINTSVDLTLLGLLDYTDAELTGAKAYIYDDKYWLKVGDRCWILDLRMSNFSQGLFCWYPYDGKPADANCFLNYSGHLYLGDDTTGLIYKDNAGLASNEAANEDGAALDFYWTSPLVSCGTRTWTKDFEELFISFGREISGHNALTFITDDGKEVVIVTVQAAQIFDFGNIDFANWSFGSNPYPSTQPEIVGYSSEYLQWKIQNNVLDEGLIILAQELTYRIGERV